MTTGEEALRQYHMTEIRRLELLIGKVLVISGEGTVLTVKHLWRHRRPGRRRRSYR